MGHKCLYYIFPFPCKWKLAHSIMCPQAADREGSIQTWRGSWICSHQQVTTAASKVKNHWPQIWTSHLKTLFLALQILWHGLSLQSTSSRKWPIVTALPLNTSCGKGITKCLKFMGLATLHSEGIYHIIKVSKCPTMLDSLELRAPSSLLRSIMSRRWNAGDAAARINRWAEKPTLPATSITSVYACCSHNVCTFSTYVLAATCSSGFGGFGGLKGAWNSY